MILGKWEDIPKNIKNQKTYEYYKKLQERKESLIIKRFFDILFSLILLILLLPIFIILAICIKIDSKGPVFYRQERVTQYGKSFKIFKFRTMVQNADKIGSLITVDGDSRITKVGKIIRKFRLDELPQLINILLGDMSFVGTRPEVRNYVNQYTDEMKATLLMPAGVTSEASIKYKNEDSVVSTYISKGENLEEIYVKRVLPQKMKYNLDYINNFSFAEDIKIIVKTVLAVLNIKGEEKATVEQVTQTKESFEETQPDKVLTKQ